MHGTQNKSKAVRRTAAPAHKEAGPATRRRTLVGSSSSLGGFYRTASPLVGSLSSFSVYMWVLARLPCWWVLSSFSLGGFCSLSISSLGTFGCATSTNDPWSNLRRLRFPEPVRETSGGSDYITVPPVGATTGGYIYNPTNDPGGLTSGGCIFRRLDHVTCQAVGSTFGCATSPPSRDSPGAQSGAGEGARNDPCGRAHATGCGAAGRPMVKG